MNEQETATVSRVLNLGRGDVIENQSALDAKISLPGLGTILIPSDKSIRLPRKGVEIYGEWECRIVLGQDHVTLTLIEIAEEE